MKERFKVWNKWRKKNVNGRWYKLTVLLGLRRSPTFELDLVMNNIGDTFIRAGNTITQLAESMKEYSKEAVEKVNGRETENKTTD